MALHARKPERRVLLRAGLTFTALGAALGAGAGSAQAVSLPSAAEVPEQGVSALQAVGETAAPAVTSALGTSLASSVAPITDLQLDPLAGTGVDPLDNAVGTQIADSAGDHRHPYRPDHQRRFAERSARGGFGDQARHRLRRGQRRTGPPRVVGRPRSRAWGVVLPQYEEPAAPSAPVGCQTVLVSRNAVRRSVPGRPASPRSRTSRPRPQAVDGVRASDCPPPRSPAPSPARRPRRSGRSR